MTLRIRSLDHPRHISAKHAPSCPFSTLYTHALFHTDLAARPIHIERSFCGRRPLPLSLDPTPRCGVPFHRQTTTVVIEPLPTSPNVLLLRRRRLVTVVAWGTKPNPLAPCHDHTSVTKTRTDTRADPRRHSQLRSLAGHGRGEGQGPVVDCASRLHGAVAQGVGSLRGGDGRARQDGRRAALLFQPRDGREPMGRPDRHPISSALRDGAAKEDEESVVGFLVYGRK